VRGRKGDGVYFSLSVYGGPNDGRYSERIVGTVNDRMLDIAADGSFEITLSPHPHSGAWIRLESDAVAAITRDYVIDGSARRVEWPIDCLDPAPVHREDDRHLARPFRAPLTWIPQHAN